MTDYKEIDPRRGDDKIKRDQYGRYLLPDPETGEQKAWTRATTVSGTIKDRFALEKWDQRNIIYGIGQRPDLYARAAAAKRSDDDTLSEIAEHAKAAAASQSGAILGSALHQFMERIDRGEDLVIPEPYDSDVEAYRKVCEITGIATALGWLERVVIVPELSIVGMLDRLYNAMPWPLPRIGDIKTSAKDSTDFTKYGIDIPLQLAIYANASHWWDGTQWVEMPTIDRTKAMVMHVPAGRGECSVYEVDIEAGWNAVRLAIDVREWRKRKDLFEMVPAMGETEARPDGAAALDDLRARVDAIKANDKARQWLAARWPVGIPTFPKGGPRTPEEVERIAGIIAKTEEQFAVGDGDPSTEPAAEGEDGASRRGSDGAAAKGGEASPAEETPAEDPPASPSPSPNGSAGDGHGAQGDPATGNVDPTETPVPGGPDQAALDPPDPVRHAWARDRVNAIKDLGGAPRKRLAGLWSLRDEIPTFPKGGPRTSEELDAVVGMCDLVEMEFELPFGPSDPTVPEPTKADRKRDKS